MRLLDGFGRLFVAAAYLSQPKSNLSILSIEGGGVVIACCRFCLLEHRRDCCLFFSGVK